MDAIALGDLRIAWIYAGFTGGLIIILSVAGYFLTAYENSVNRELGSLLGLDGPWLMAKGRAAFLCSLICVWAFGRTFLGSLGDRISRLTPTLNSNGVVEGWEAEFALSGRHHMFAEKDITSWTSQIDWAGRTPMRVFVINLKGGQHLTSIKANPTEHEKAIEMLRGFGVEIQGLRKEAESSSEGKSPSRENSHSSIGI